jgi:hypothetical protein
MGDVEISYAQVSHDLYFVLKPDNTHEIHDDNERKSSGINLRKFSLDFFESTSISIEFISSTTIHLISEIIYAPYNASFYLRSRAPPISLS